MTVQIFGPERCRLGEGPLVHDGRLFWFDILQKQLHSRRFDGSDPRHFQFDLHCSAAARLDDGRFLVASERGLFALDLESGGQTPVCDLEADNPVTRSNDGRADRRGGFWIGTMGFNAEPGAGAIYRYHRGTLRKLRPGITISNAICFAPDGGTAYFTDTAENILYAWSLDADGWPVGAPQPLLDKRGADFGLDGAVVDSEGAIWVACWGASQVMRLSPEGKVLRTEKLPAAQTTCPAFGGDDLRTLFVTSAWQGLPEVERGPTEAGAVFSLPIAVAGLEDPVVSL
ncbi:SMP-30/gluconolactonase/LRE family protein [Oceanomicrobium pacificus]|uniref:SMP-30/gluconolactonase/LRE family protein n=1 Tax=Oceanomicrobium pacificus TaxID=2692916 RepID=A0A6B0TPE0_9RHOB|nr:SMP-30/gluconolactonase/LRE family protein [Oceanomicrobium pacificus]MXU66500.1 SMP-30/gluconolactonase/LRE family protein [Oceanomicrobium pacificus]